MTTPPQNAATPSSIFCNESILHILQTSPHRPFPDSKTLVDLPLLKTPQQTLKTFQSLPASQPLSPKTYTTLLSSTFSPTPDKLPNSSPLTLPHHPDDYTPSPPSFLTPHLHATRPTLTTFLTDLKSRWLSLCRRHNPTLFSTSTTHDPHAPSSQTSLLPLPNPFFIPGGRFRECYYWDTLWIIKGLLASDMIPSALSSLHNLTSLAKTYSFIPNGARTYYLNRSQPPILSLAIQHTLAFLPPPQQIHHIRTTLPALDAELTFFHTHRSVATIVPTSPLAKCTLALYGADTTAPRPESFVEDVRTGVEAAAKFGRDCREVYRDVSAAAESGWDFSSRWMALEDEEGEEESLARIRTTRIIPVCLNSLLLRAEQLASSYHAQLARDIHSDSGEESAEQRNFNEKKSAYYAEIAQQRQRAMTEVMWSAQHGVWFDVDADTGKRTGCISAACTFPLLADVPLGETNNASDAKRLVTFLTKTSTLLSPGGLTATTARHSTQQWDWPNVWPPLTDLTVTALDKLHARFPDVGAKEAARDVAFRFVRSAFRCWRREGGVMHEKYDGRVMEGRRGAGGEYEPQMGFGWTNGVVLWLVRRFVTEDEGFWDGME